MSENSKSPDQLPSNVAEFPQTQDIRERIRKVSGKLVLPTTLEEIRAMSDEERAELDRYVHTFPSEDDTVASLNPELDKAKRVLIEALDGIFRK